MLIILFICFLYFYLKIIFLLSLICVFSTCLKFDFICKNFWSMCWCRDIMHFIFAICYFHLFNHWLYMPLLDMDVGSIIKIFVHQVFSYDLIFNKSVKTLVSIVCFVPIRSFSLEDSHLFGFQLSWIISYSRDTI